MGKKKAAAIGVGGFGIGLVMWVLERAKVDVPVPALIVFGLIGVGMVLYMLIMLIPDVVGFSRRIRLHLELQPPNLLGTPQSPKEQEQTRFTISDFESLASILAGFLTRVGQVRQTHSPLISPSQQETSASPSGSMVRAGGLTIEPSTTSTSPTDLATVAGLHIRPSATFIVICQFQQFPAKGVSIGLKLNGNQVWQPNPQISPDDSTKGVVLWFVNRVLEAKNKAVQMYVPTTTTEHKNISQGARPIQTITDVSVSISTNDHNASVSIQTVEVFTLPSDD